MMRNAFNGCKSLKTINTSDGGVIDVTYPNSFPVATPSLDRLAGSNCFHWEFLTFKHIMLPEGLSEISGKWFRDTEV